MITLQSGNDKRDLSEGKIQARNKSLYGSLETGNFAITQCDGLIVFKIGAKHERNNGFAEIN